MDLIGDPKKLTDAAAASFEPVINRAIPQLKEAALDLLTQVEVSATVVDGGVKLSFARKAAVQINPPTSSSGTSIILQQGEPLSG